MVGKHRNWHQHWEIDLTAGRATHRSGLVATFLLLPLSEDDEVAHADAAVIGKCWTADGRQWGIVTTTGLLENTFEALKVAHGPHNAQAMLARFGREAGELWAWHKAREH